MQIIETESQTGNTKFVTDGLQVTSFKNFLRHVTLYHSFQIT